MSFANGFAMLISCLWSARSANSLNSPRFFQEHRSGISDKIAAGGLAHAGPEQSNPWGRLTRLFFSYPLPFEIRGAFARTDTETGRRTIKAAFYRILDQSADPEIIEYRTGEKSERLTVEGQNYGEFSIYVFVFKDAGSLANYVDSRHPVLLTLNGQNHGEMTRTVITNANLPELASSTVVEVRLIG